MVKKDYVIFKVEWKTQLQISPPVPDWENIMRHYCWTLINFLQEKKMVTRPLANSLEDMTDEFELKLSDLTSQGDLFYSFIEEKWGNQTAGKDEDLLEQVQDKAVLERAYQKFLKAEG